MNNIPGPPDGYIDILDRAVLSAIEKEEMVFNPLRPSSAGKCRKELGYEYMNFKGFAKYESEAISPNQKRIFGLGHSVEFHLLRQFSHVVEFATTYKQQRLLVTKLRDGQFITGSTDMCFWSEKYKCVADVKSKKDKFSAFYSNDWKETSEKFKAMKSVHTVNDRVYWIDNLGAFLEELYIVDPRGAPWLERNFLQLNLYTVNPFFVEQGVDHAAVIQYNKNDSTLRELRFRPSQEIADQIVKDFHTVHDTIMEDKNTDRLPRDFNLGSGPCAFCSYKDMCREGEDPLKEHFNEHYPKKKWPKDVSRIKDGGHTLESLYDVYKQGQLVGKKVERVEQEILKMMEDKKLWKLKFEDGHIYQRKEYKSPRPHWKLKRIKL